MMVKVFNTVLPNVEVRQFFLLYNMCFIVHNIIRLQYIIIFVNILVVFPKF